MKVAVIGFGHIGSVIGAVLANRGVTVVGIDTNRDLLDAFARGDEPIKEKNLQKLLSKAISREDLTLTSDIEEVRDVDVILITVGTPLMDDNKADLSPLINACDMAKPYVKNGQLVIVKSTVPPGTTRDVVHKIFNETCKIDVVFSPERLAEGNAIDEFTALPIIVGGVSEGATNKAFDFWSNTLGFEAIMVDSVEAAEMVKLADNMWIDLNIALSHDLAKVCDAIPYDVDVLEVIRAANTLKKGSGHVNILTPSNGVGGYCLTKDPWFVYTLGKEYGLDLETVKSGRSVNDSMPEYTANIISDFFQVHSKNINKIKIAVLGVSFKTNTGDIRFTPVLPFIDSLRNAGFANIEIYDSLVTDCDERTLNIKLNRSMKDTLEDADCVAFMAAHEDIAALTPEDLRVNCASGALVLDGRRYFSRSDINEMKSLDFTYKGVGR